LLAVVFKQHGAEVLTASSSQDALDLFRHADIDVLVSDLQMPDEDGYELIAKMRALAAEKGTPLLTALAVTAHAKAEDRARALQAGYQAHVPKPVDPGELVLMVASLAGSTSIPTGD
jgi:CheY-like chemotaxis protein